jgi:hypothetical protein
VARCWVRWWWVAWWLNVISGEPGFVAIDEGEAKADVAGMASVAPATLAMTIFAPSPPRTAARSPTVHDGSLRCCGMCRPLVPAAFFLLLMIGLS